MALEPLCAPWGHRVREATPARLSDEGIIGARRGPANHDTTGWVSHLPAHKTRTLAGQQTWDSYERIAVLRNPFDKAMSWFFWAYRHKPVRAEDRIPAFRAFLKDRAQSGYFKSEADVDWQCCHIDGRPVIDRYLKLETLRSDLDSLASRWGLAEGALPIPATKTKMRSSDALPISASRTSANRPTAVDAACPRSDMTSGC